MRVNPALCLAALFLAAAAQADQFLIAGQTREGRLKGFSGGRFEFSTERGRASKESASRVTKLTLSEPVEVNFTTSDGKLHKSARFKGYAMGTFRLTPKDGEEMSVPQIKMRSLEVVHRQEEAPAGDGGDAGGALPPLDLSGLDKAGLNANQVSAVENYVAARKAYDEFVAQSSRLVNEMNGLTGPQREALLNQLRQRKGEEQPIRARMSSAEAALKAALPGGAGKDQR